MREPNEKEKSRSVQLRGMSDLRELMRQQYEAVSDRSKPLDLPRERLLIDIQRNLIASVRLEVEYTGIMKGAVEAPFIEAEDAPNERNDPLLSGPKADHPWRGGSTLHKLKG